MHNKAKQTHFLFCLHPAELDQREKTTWFSHVSSAGRLSLFKTKCHKTLTTFPTLVSCHCVYCISLLDDSTNCLRFFNLSFSFSLAHYKLHRHPRDQQRETFPFTGAIPLPVSVHALYHWGQGEPCEQPFRSIFPSLIFLILPLSSFFYSSHFHPIAPGKGFSPPHCVLAGLLSIIPVLLHVLFSALFCSVSVPLSPRKHLMMCRVCQTGPRPLCPGEPVLSRPCHLWSSLRWQEHVRNKALDGMHGRDKYKRADEWMECGEMGI